MLNRGKKIPSTRNVQLGDASGTAPVPIVEAVRKRQAGLTASERVIANYLLAHLRELPFLTGTAIAQAVGVSQMTVSRFLRSLGYGGLVAVKQELRKSLRRAPLPASGKDQRPVGSSDGREWLARCLDTEIKALVAAYELAGTDEFRRTAEVIAQSTTVFVSAFQSVRGVALDFVQRLEIARDKVRFLGGENGTYLELFATDDQSRVLIVIDIQRYSKQARLLAEGAKKAGIPLVIVADKTCGWALRCTDFSFLVETNVGTFWESNAPLTSFLNLLTDAAIEQLGGTVGARVSRLHDLQARFDAFRD